MATRNSTGAPASPKQGKRHTRHRSLEAAGHSGSQRRLGLIYIHADIAKRQARKLAGNIVAALLEQDYVSGIFVDQARLGEFRARCQPS